MPSGPCRRLVIFPGSVWRAQVEVGSCRGGIKVASERRVEVCNILFCIRGVKKRCRPPPYYFNRAFVV